jgi:sortase A
VPAIGLDTVVKYVPFDGLTWMIAGLHQEVAWMGDTSWPGLGGNTALAGHITLRTGGDGPFRHLDLLAAGDEITLATDQNIYLYRVVESRVVDETDLSILQSSGGSRLTLITCSDWNGTTGFYMRRLAVSAELVETTPIKAAALLN